MKFLMCILALGLFGPLHADDARIRYFGQEYPAPTFKETLAMFSGQWRPLPSSPRLLVIPGYTPEDQSNVRETVFAFYGLDKKPYQVGYARVSRKDCEDRKGNLEILATPRNHRPRLFTMTFSSQSMRPRDHLAAYVCEVFKSP